MRVSCQFLMATVLAAMVAGSSAAQLQQPPGEFGQWAGPFPLGSQIGGGGWAEIAHAVVLPPDNDGWVVFWCPRGCSPSDCSTTTVFDAFDTFFWHPRAPDTVHTVSTPLLQPALPEGSADLFCGSHIQWPSGEILSFGGSDAHHGCNVGSACSIAYGHTKVWILDATPIVGGPLNPTVFPSWHRPSNGTSGDMVRERWYPTAVSTALGDAFVGGHQWAPTVIPPGVEPTRRTWERGALNALDVDWVSPPSGQDVSYNRVHDATGCAATGLISLRGYPRMFQLASGEFMSLLTDSQGVASTAFLEFGACPQSTVESDRWRLGASGTYGVDLPTPFGSPAVHYIDDRGATPTETIYSIGGAELDTACVTQQGTPNDTITANVLRMVDPSATAPWETTILNGAGTPVELDMLLPRLDANGIVLLDGSLLVVGGFGPPDAAGVCQNQVAPEVLRPPEAFATGNTWGWKAMNPQGNWRIYHSVAGLLPDGRVFSAGGRDQDDGVTVSRHSIEIYSPPYMFQGQRPKIVSISDVTPGHGDVVSITATLPNGAPGGQASEFRVALLRPGSITHAFDCNQRYIVVDITTQPIPTGNPDEWFFTVEVPVNASIAPPGDYMVTVVGTTGLPSKAAWIEIGA